MPELISIPVKFLLVRPTSYEIDNIFQGGLVWLCFPFGSCLCPADIEPVFFEKDKKFALLTFFGNFYSRWEIPETIYQTGMLLLDFQELVQNLRVKTLFIQFVRIFLYSIVKPCGTRFLVNIKDLGIFAKGSVDQEHFIGSNFAGFYKYRTFFSGEEIYDVESIEDFFTDTIDPSEPLNYPDGVPGYIIIDHHTGSIEVKTF